MTVPCAGINGPLLGPPLGSLRFGARSRTTTQPLSFSGSTSRITLAYEFGSAGKRSVPANRHTAEPESAGSGWRSVTLGDGPDGCNATSGRAVCGVVAEGAEVDDTHEAVTSNDRR